MKSFRFLLLLPILFITSCGDQYYYTEEVVINTKTVYYPVSSKDWKKMDVPPTWNDPDEDSKWTYFFFDFDEPLLTSGQLNKGMMNAYLATKDGSIDVFTPLPYDNFYKDPNGFMWIEQATCEFSRGSIRFIVKYSDFNMRIKPENYTFMVRYAW